MMKKLPLLIFLLGVGMAASAYAAPSQAPLTVIVQGDGIVTSDPAGITCPGDCNESYKKNTTVTLTASPEPTSSFIGWGPNGACVGTDPICTIQIKEPSTVTALFDNAIATSTLPATGQTTCWDDAGNPIPCGGTGQDGEIQAGVPLSYTDTGLTIIDNNTNLEWMKHDDNDLLDPLACNSFPGYLDKDCRFYWNEMSTFITSLNAANHAGHSDWRVPNVRELQSIVNYEYFLPSVSDAFNTGCVPGCTWETCSCTGLNSWSSNTDARIPSNGAWEVVFNHGEVAIDFKTLAKRVRAVRGGL